MKIHSRIKREENRKPGIPLIIRLMELYVYVFAIAILIAWFR